MSLKVTSSWIINSVCQTGNQYFQYGIIITLKLVVDPFYLETYEKRDLY